MARFKLPTLTYPLTVDTVGKTLALGHEVEAFCHTEFCRHKARINLVSYAKRFGRDAPCGHDDLVKVYYCPRCREAGRPDKNLGFITSALTAEHSRWPQEVRSVNPYERAKGR